MWVGLFGLKMKSTRKCCLAVHCSQKWKPNCRQSFRTGGHYIFNDPPASIPEVIDSNLGLLNLS